MLIDQLDFVSLRKEEPRNRFTRFVEFAFGRYLRDVTRPTRPTSWGQDLYYYQEETISTIVAVLVIVIASAFLVGAMASLYYVSSIGAILGIVAAFTVVFAGVLGLLTNAKRAEVFAATAA